eukprot:76753_1
MSASKRMLRNHSKTNTSNDTKSNKPHRMLRKHKQHVPVPDNWNIEAMEQIETNFPSTVSSVYHGNWENNRILAMCSPSNRQIHIYADQHSKYFIVEVTKEGNYVRAFRVYYMG